MDSPVILTSIQADKNGPDRINPLLAYQPILTVRLMTEQLRQLHQAQLTLRFMTGIRVQISGLIAYEEDGPKVMSLSFECII